ncbi:putative pyrophosphatase or phosphodiesterase, AlkP superfamily [Streptoalloteichus tenebrarius]|uniref:Pyrophosphatase or phosphodiesterase, AlkP superfamily n=1 Tax=Streptoalloteichus tenebrarius (strain ATCC 17920 / DSM 40477 / JCM 4838 / CBS 697.72 / NBRC 16177 / NCIMB 11028 / NRRL B-12390 / A12253. 1 / ISP 5477) TaxID=1933 RepID=A0ABT1HNX3_STRSD|nr:nucleotide pyrophosphatase/phosphodiesterase family protein [Streptoalloteichus tenebrarius]MCP2257207.1 putative pyrophosphatase or phosphodiesterase, AlkP superfamily [Streptoalloteichus tenebrarius]BFE98842.1 alkaline phosphatase family protein [Streptoalloteichus tenebrarius]
MEFLLPTYSTGTLADVVPSLLAGLGVPGTSDVLGLPGAPRVCLLLVDGLGWELLRSHAADAPFLSSLAAERDPITAGFPATTATSLSTLGTGRPSGEHGMVGYSFAPDDNEVLNVLRWQRHGDGAHVDLRSQYVPEQIQPHRTVFEQAADAGVEVRLVAPGAQDGSGLTRAVLRGGQFRGTYALGDLTTHVLDALSGHPRVLCYAYHADLDMLGHIYGAGSTPWRAQLRYVDQLAATIAEGLPSDSMLVVTADHGMVNAGEQDRVDIDTEPALLDGVRMLGGEARVRHVYTAQGAVEDVRRAWSEVLGERALVLPRDEAISAGWFGPRVDDRVRPRVGDLVVAALGSFVMVRSQAEPQLSLLPGQHGSLTREEQLVPLLTATKDD